MCAEIQTPLEDLQPTTNALVINGETPTPLSPLSAKVYMMKYKLKGDTEFRSSILTVPVTPPAGVPTVSVQNETAGANGYPLIMYAHAGNGGLAYEEIAQSLGLLQSAYIIAAPVFPGEPLCNSYDKGTTTCTLANIKTAAVGTSLPYENDATDLLGLHDCVKTFAAGAAKATSTGTEDLGAKILKISGAAQTAFATSNPIKAAAAGAPVTIVAGLGRGAAVAGLALARAGAYNTVFGGTDTAAITALATKGVKPSMFSCSLMAAPQASFVTGFNRLYLDYWVRGTSNALNAQILEASEMIPGFRAIHAKFSAIRANAALSEEQKVDAIVAYSKSIDLVNQTYLMHFGLQNFGKYLTAERIGTADEAAKTSAALTLKNAQGAALVMHGIQDRIANISNSALLTNIGVRISSNLQTPETGAAVNAGIRWLGLGISPPDTSLDEYGELLPNDYGHVNDLGFLTGTSASSGGLESNISEDSFYELMPAQLIASWLGSQCRLSMSANSGAE
ncbi:MAG: hypothetical protein EOP10_26625 [Proteobacteria bacterium]|nr:MAG: hypothetical protein EOP10_26625 [Pseudomonadota bacterium]